MVGGRSSHRSCWFEAESTGAAQSGRRVSGQPELLGRRQAILRSRERIKVPTLVVVAEWDRVTPSQGAQALFHKLPSGPHKRLVEIGEGTHFVMLEKNRMQLFQEVQFFLDGPRRN